MLKEFTTFIARGNVLDLAVAVIIGTAFGAIVTSLTEDVIMPVIGMLTGGIDFTSNFIRLGPLPDGYSGPMTYAALKEAGVPLFGWGAFLTALVRFLILAFVIFQLVRIANRIFGAPAAPAVPDDVRLLTEIRDELRSRSKS